MARQKTGPDSRKRAASAGADQGGRRSASSETPSGAKGSPSGRRISWPLLAGVGAIIVTSVPLGVLLFKRHMSDARSPAAPVAATVAQKSVEREVNIDVGGWMAADEEKPPVAVEQPATAEPEQPATAEQPARGQREALERAAARQARVRRGSRSRAAAAKRAKAGDKGRSQKTSSSDPGTRVDYGLLYVTSTPSSKVYVDGALQGFTPQNGLRIPPGKHVLSFRTEGMRQHKREIDVQAGEKQVLEVALVPLAPVAAAVTSPQPAVVAPVPAASPRAPADEGTKPAPKAKVAVPRLRLPATVKLALYQDGEKSKKPRVVCYAVERTVSNAIGRSAAGTTRALLDHLFATNSDPDGPQVTMYPRTMGYLIADALLNDKPGIGSRLVGYQKNGRMATLAGSNWRP